MSREGMTGIDIYHWYITLKAQKQPKIDLMQQIDEFFNPSDYNWTGQHPVGLSDQQGELLDTTGTDLIEEYVSYVLGLQFNTANRWFTINHPDLDFENPDAQVYEKRAEKLYKLIGKTNYYTQCPLLERDALVQGHGIMVMEEDIDNFVKVYTKDPKHVYLEQSESGDIIGFAYEMNLTVMQLIDKFPELQRDELLMGVFSNNYMRTFPLITTVLPNKPPYQSMEGKKKENVNKKYEVRYLLYDSNGLTEGSERSSLLDPELKDSKTSVYDIEKTEYKNNMNMFPVRDMITRHHPYGEGIGKKALPKSRILNKMKASLLNFASLQANPPRIQTTQLSEEVGTVQTIDQPLKEGQTFVIPIDFLAGEHRQQPPVQLLQVTGDLSAMFEMYQGEQAQLAALLPVAGQIYKNARQSMGEIEQRVSEQEKRLAPIRANYLREATSAHLKEFYRIAKKRGEFNEEGLQLNNPDLEKNMEFTFDAFLLGTYKQAKAMRAAQALQLVANFLSLKPSGADLIDIDRLVKHTFAGNSVLDMLLTDEEVAAQREQTAQMAEQQRALQEQEVNAKSGQAMSQGLAALMSSQEG